MLDKDNRKVLEGNQFLRNRQESKAKERYAKTKGTLFIAAIVVGFFMIACLYFLSDYSKVYHVAIIGNENYSDSYIRELAGIDEEDYFLFVPKREIKKRIESDELIDSVKVDKIKGNLIRITVHECQLIGYTSDSGVVRYLLSDGNTVLLSDDNKSILKNVPLIEGFTSEKQEKLAKTFGGIDKAVIKEISEIHHYPTSYDEDMLELIMRDGNYCFVSMLGVSLLDNYYYAVDQLELGDEKACLYIDEITNTCQYRKCPWESTTETSQEIEE